MARRAVIVACCLLTVALVLHSAQGLARVAVQRPLAQLPDVLGPWHAQGAAPIDNETLSVLGVDDYVSRVYAQPAAPPVALYVGFYGSQAEGDTIHSPLNCLPGAGWQPVSRERLDVHVRPTAASAPLPVTVNRLVIEKGLDRELVLYWYQSHGRVTASEYWGRALLVWDAVRLARTDGALVRVISPVASSSGAAEAASQQTAVSFVETLFPVLGTYLPR